jgi:hypothetical protein
VITREIKTLTGSAGAVFSDCEQYRYRLWREWDNRLPSLCFVMLNPSTASEQEDDSTITRCIGRAAALQCGRLDVVNLFPYRLTDSKLLGSIADPLGPVGKADGAILDAVDHASRVICAWGAHSVATARAADVLSIFQITGMVGKLYHLGLNQDGSPKHPLYIASKVTPKRFQI